MIEQSPLELGLECLKARKVDEAIEYFEQATAEFPEDYKGFNYLGVAYGQKGLYDRAIGAFQTALQIRSDVPSIHYNLGVAYQADGFFDQAREQFQQALGLDASYSKALEALKALDIQQQSAESVSAQACARHPDEPAADICSFCRLPVCQECMTIIDGETYCTKCAEQQREG